MVLKAISRLICGFWPSLVTAQYRVSERIVEIPFVMRNISEEDQRILDVGSCENPLALELAHLGFRVWGVDQRDYGLSHPNFTFVRADILDTGLPAEYFDVAISLSTLEHVGIGFYGDQQHAEGDFRAVAELRRVLKPGGRLILTAPYGQPAVSWQRVYDSARLQSLLSDFKVEKSRYCRKVGEAWVEASESEAGLVDSSLETRAVVLLVARR